MHSDIPEQKLSLNLFGMIAPFSGKRLGCFWNAAQIMDSSCIGNSHAPAIYQCGETHRGLDDLKQRATLSA